jgi:phosphoribosylformimino-5-aminoimidazole carboxamide ribotide isomerase
MVIYPAIDLKGGKCVRLYQGKMSKAEIVAEDPLENALKLEKKGAQYIHVVDLDGAMKGKPQNMSSILSIVSKLNIPVQIGGGIRDLDTVKELISAGASRVILGTIALENIELVYECVKRYKEKIAVGIDAKDGFVAGRGWVNVSSINYIDLAKNIEKAGVETIIYTDISRDGTLIGANIDGLKLLSENVNCNVIASGGVKNLEDLIQLKKIGVEGVIIGKAIYNGNIILEEAIECGRN